MLPGNDRAPSLRSAIRAVSTSSIASPAATAPLATASRAPGIFRSASSVTYGPRGPTPGQVHSSIETRRISELQTVGSHET